MRIGDIARLAGVTVRTVRHYYQIGLLAEPPRDANGYRRYGIADLIRLMRIVRLKGLGLPLDAIAPLLDDDQASGDSAAVLDRLDRDLGREIERLKAQRRTVRQLRQGAVPLDMPPDFAASFAALELGRTDRVNKAGREQAVIMAHMMRDEAGPALARLYDRLASPEFSATYRALGERFDQVGEGTSDAEIERLAQDYVEGLGDWIDDYSAALAGSRSNVGAVLGAHAAKSVTARERDLVAAIGRWMARRRR